jgi:cell division protein FtsB
MRMLAVILTALFLMLQHDLWFGEGSIASARNLKSSIEHQSKNNETDLERNNMLAAEVDDLHNGTDAVEERARSELGMIKNNETFIQIIHSESNND